MSLYKRNNGVQLFGTLMTIIHQIIECNDEIAKITIQLNQINVTVVCKNNDLLVKDVKRVCYIDVFMINSFNKRMLVFFKN